MILALVIRQSGLDSGLGGFQVKLHEGVPELFDADPKMLFSEEGITHTVSTTFIKILRFFFLYTVA